MKTARPDTEDDTLNIKSTISQNLIKCFQQAMRCDYTGPNASADTTTSTGWTNSQTLLQSSWLCSEAGFSVRKEKSFISKFNRLKWEVFEGYLEGVIGEGKAEDTPGGGIQGLLQSLEIPVVLGEGMVPGSKPRPPACKMALWASCPVTDGDSSLKGWNIL